MTHAELCAYCSTDTTWPYVRPPEGHPWEHLAQSPLQHVGEVCPRCKGAHTDPVVRGFCKLCNGVGRVRDMREDP